MNPEAARHLHVATGPDGPETSTAPQVEMPTPLSRAEVLPPFPVDALPAWVGDYVAAVATETQTPPDLPGCIGLAALSTAAGGRARVAVRGRWSEPLNIFTVVALPPGSRKSAVFSAMIRPILDIERDLAEAARPRIEAARMERSIATDRADKARKSAVSADRGREREALGLAADAAAQAEAIEVPTLPRLVADDVTPEKAASLIAEHGGRIAVLSAEGGIFATLAGRYSTAPNFDVFLKGHAGEEPLIVDRHGRPSEHVDRPALTLGLAVQPEVLAEIARIPGGRGKGLLGRILYALPADLVGYREIDPPTVPDHVAETYASRLHTLVSCLVDLAEPLQLTLTEEALVVVHDLLAETEPKLAAGAEWSHARDWYGKWVGAVARIAGLLHLATHRAESVRRPIDVDTMAGAARIGRYYADHALAALDAMGSDPAVDAARHLLGWIERTRPERFTVRDAHRANRGRLRAVAEVTPALEVLEAYGHVRRIPEQPRDGPGRKPSPAYVPHPCYRTGGSR